MEEGATGIEGRPEPDECQNPVSNLKEPSEEGNDDSAMMSGNQRKKREIRSVQI
jgi:hypothetical protein